MLPQQYCLRWKYHHSNLQTMFSQLLDRGCFCDVTLACEGQLIRAHRVVLCACSTFFDTVLTNYATERDPIVIMKDAKFSDVKCLIEFMYKGEINVEYSNLASLLKTAEDLKIKGLAEVSWREEEFDSTIPMAEATLRIQDDFDANHMKRMTETISTQAEPHILHKLPTLTPMPSLNHEILGTRRKRGRPPLDESYDVFSSPKAAAIEKINISTPLISHKEKSNSHRLPQPPLLPQNLQPQQQPSPPQAQQQQEQQHQKQKDLENNLQLEDNHQQNRQHIQHQLQHPCNHHPVLNEEEEMINAKASQHLSEYQNRTDGETWPPSVDRHPQVDSDSDNDEKPEIPSELILDENHYGDEQETNNETRELIDSHQQMERDAEEHDDNLSSDHKMEELDIGDYKLTDEELHKWKDVIKMDAYLATGRRPQFWEEPFTRRILEAIREKKLEMKKAARLLGVSYGTLYGRYREVYGCLKHPFRGTSAMMSRYEHWPSKTISVLETKTALPKDTDELWLR